MPLLGLAERLKYCLRGLGEFVLCLSGDLSLSSFSL